MRPHAAAAAAPPPPRPLFPPRSLRRRFRYTELRQLLVEPIQGDGKRRVQCYVVRHKQRVGSTRFDFYMCLSKEQDMYCFTGRKQKVAKGCYYSISLDSDERKRSKGQSEESQFIGKVRTPTPQRRHVLPGHVPPHLSSH